MPLKQGRNRQVISDNIRELHQGPQFQRTRRKFGKAKANKQAVAIALEQARQSKGRTGLASV
jgi:hypothetical protein